MAGCVISREQRQINLLREADVLFCRYTFGQVLADQQMEQIFFHFNLRNHHNLREIILHTVIMRFIRSAC